MCGWWEEVENDDEWLAVVRYSLHQLSVHPRTALYDSVVLMYVQTVAAMVAPTNGVLTQPND